jgi:hypothetical protein
MVANKAKRTQKRYAAKECKEGMKQTKLAAFMRPSNIAVMVDPTDTALHPRDSTSPTLVESDEAISNLDGVIANLDDRHPPNSQTESVPGHGL